MVDNDFLQCSHRSPPHSAGADRFRSRLHNRRLEASWIGGLVIVARRSHNRGLPRKAASLVAGPLFETWTLLTAVGWVLCLYGRVCAAEQDGPATRERLVGSPASAALTLHPTPSPAALRLEVPDRSATDEACRLIKQAYADDYESAELNPAPLIKKLLDAASQTVDPARKYAFLIEAEEAAVAGNDLARAMELIDVRASGFKIDVVASRVERLTAALTPQAKKNLVVLSALYDCAVSTAARGQEQDSLKQAESAAELAGAIARAFLIASKAKPATSIKQDWEARQRDARSLVKQIQRRAKMYADYERALETLAETPDDPGAQGVAGEYLCFERSDWKKGLGHLAKSDRDDMNAIAASEIRLMEEARPEPQHVFDLAARWWIAADAKGLSASAQASVKQHAASLYGLVLGSLKDPVDKALAKKRIQEGDPKTAGHAGIQGEPKPDPKISHAKAIDLLAIIDPARDAAMGRWSKLDDGSVRFDHAATLNGKLEIPYKPLIAEYDLSVEVDVVGGARNIVLYILIANRTHFFILKPFATENIPYLPGARCELAFGKPQMLVVQVRHAGVSVFVDGQRVADGRVMAMRPNDYWQLRRNDVFGIGAHESSLVFRSLRLTQPVRD
jgi:hypothetical protein